jgi:hypothetical protein
VVISVLEKGPDAPPVQREGGFCTGPLTAPVRTLYSANNYGEIRTWRYVGNYEHATDPTRSQLHASLAHTHTFQAHESAVDNVLVVGNLLLTTGKESRIRVWGGDSRTGWHEGLLCELVVGANKDQSNTRSIIDPRWDQRKVVGLSFVDGNLVGLRQDGVMTKFAFECKAPGGAPKRGSAEGGGGEAGQKAKVSKKG